MNQSQESGNGEALKIVVNIEPISMKTILSNFGNYCYIGECFLFLWYKTNNILRKLGEKGEKKEESRCKRLISSFL